VDEVSARVRAQYEEYPYPHWPVETVPEQLSIAASYTLARYELNHRLAVPDGKRALIAGCGTGFELHATAAYNPGYAEIIGVDFAEASLKVARQRVAFHQLGNCRVLRADLLKPETLPAGPFDYIGSHGVLHHLADPAQGLRHLAARLAPDGIMAIMLYNRIGRWPLYQAREALRLLGLYEKPLAQQVSVLRSMIASAQPGSLFNIITSGDHNTEYYRHDTNLVDNFLHANDQPLSVGELPAFLAAAGLEFLGMADQSRWRLATTMHPSCQPFYEAARGLPGLAQLGVIEALNPFNNTEMIFWACHLDQATAPWQFTPTSFRAERWQVNPVFARHAVVTSESRSGETVRVVEWPLFFPTQRALWPDSWQHKILTSIWHAPKSGEELLAAIPPAGGLGEGEGHVKWLASWERDRVILRV